MSAKEYKTIKELTGYLKNKKHFFVRESDIHYLEDVNYITLVNPFKELFCNGRDSDGCHIYTKDRDFINIVKAYEIDRGASRHLHNIIGRFEIRFKNIIFSELCALYCSAGDIHCTEYVKEIREYLTKLDMLHAGEILRIPLLCPNINNVLTNKGYKLSDYEYTTRIDLLKRLYANGTGFTLDGVKENVRNNLLKHYLREQSIVPLWVIPNILTFGDLSIVYSMLDYNTQCRIYKKIVGEKSGEEDIVCPYKEIRRFTGKLEFIRNLRNCINHYEPIFPLCVNCFEKVKEFPNSTLAKSLQLLMPDLQIMPFDYRKESSIDIDVDVNSNNLKQIRLIEFLEMIAK